MAERSLKNSFGKIYQRTGFKQNAYFRITDLLGEKPSRALDTVLAKTGQAEDADPRSTAKARAAYRKFSNQLKDALRLKSMGASPQTQKLLLAQTLKNFLTAAKGRKISKFFFEQVNNDFRRIGELYNAPETETERKEREKKEKPDEEKQGAPQKTSTKISNKKIDETKAAERVLTKEAIEKVKAELAKEEDEIEELQKELAKEVAEQPQEVEIPAEAMVSLQPVGNEDRGAFSRRIAEALLSGQITNLEDLKGIKDQNLNGLLASIAVEVKKGGNESLAKGVAGQIDNPGRRDFVLTLVANAKPNALAPQASTPPAAAETSTQAPEIQIQIQGIKDGVKNQTGKDVDDQTAEKIRLKIDGWNRQDGQDHFQNSEKINQAAKEVETEQGQNKQIQASLKNRGIDVDDRTADQVRQKIDGWNRADGKDYFNDDDQIQEAYKQTEPTAPQQPEPTVAREEEPPVPNKAAPGKSEPTSKSVTEEKTVAPSEPTPPPVAPTEKPVGQATPPPLPKEALEHASREPKTQKPATMTPGPGALPEAEGQPQSQEPEEKLAGTIEPGETPPETTEPEETIPPEQVSEPTEEGTDKKTAEPGTVPLLPDKKSDRDISARRFGRSAESDRAELMNEGIEGGNTPASLGFDQQQEAASSIERDKALAAKEERDNAVEEDEQAAGAPTGVQEDQAEEPGREATAPQTAIESLRTVRAAQEHEIAEASLAEKEEELKKRKKRQQIYLSYIKWCACCVVIPFALFFLLAGNKEKIIKLEGEIKAIKAKKSLAQKK